MKNPPFNTLVWGSFRLAPINPPLLYTILSLFISKKRTC